MLLTIILCVLLIGADQLFKVLAVYYLKPIGTAPVIPGVVGLRYVENTGAAFSMLAGKQLFLILLTGAVLLVGAYILLFKRPKGKLEYSALIMIFSGGVGNLIDRIVNGYVVDYIDLLFMRFAVFNFADILVCVGFALMAFAIIREESRASKKKKEAEKDVAREETSDKTVADNALTAETKEEAAAALRSPQASLAQDADNDKH